ncbi:hypothetical protein T01_10686 [Trichinella spiralis]|uniref:Uncharacterized protein n=1 Tax=Trichinella spiralis TaxID=6334 RepID=A0A0V1BWH2_TRISP|nr:hypothetical protein T01_10686 [Trichinella spiralis]
MKISCTILVLSFEYMPLKSKGNFLQYILFPSLIDFIISMQILCNASVSIVLKKRLCWKNAV